MGGYGSGRPGWKRKTRELLRLDVGSLYKGGTFNAGTAGTITWSRGEGKNPNVSFQGFGHSMQLVFRVRIDGGEWETVTQTVYLERTPCHFGGERPWFLCPHCGRRVAVLYGHRRFLCRTCHKLAYASQSEERHDRLLRRANKIRTRLGGELGISAIIMKPKRMRWATFERMKAEVRELEAESLILAARKFGIDVENLRG